MVAKAGIRITNSNNNHNLFDIIGNKDYFLIMKTINGVKYSPIPVGTVIKKTDIFCNGHEVENFSVGKKMLKKDKRFYQVYRKIK